MLEPRHGYVYILALERKNAKALAVFKRLADLFEYSPQCVRFDTVDFQVYVLDLDAAAFDFLISVFDYVPYAAALCFRIPDFCTEDSVAHKTTDVKSSSAGPVNEFCYLFS